MRSFRTPADSSKRESAMASARKKQKKVQVNPEEKVQALVNPEDKLDCYQVAEYLQ